MKKLLFPFALLALLIPTLASGSGPEYDNAYGNQVGLVDPSGQAVSYGSASGSTSGYLSTQSTSFVRYIVGVNDVRPGFGVMRHRAIAGVERLFHDVPLGKYVATITVSGWQGWASKTLWTPASQGSQTFTAEAIALDCTATCDPDAAMPTTATFAPCTYQECPNGRSTTLFVPVNALVPGAKILVRAWLRTATEMIAPGTANAGASGYVSDISLTEAT